MPIAQISLARIIGRVETEQDAHGYLRCHRYAGDVQKQIVVLSNDDTAPVQTVTAMLRVHASAYLEVTQLTLPATAYPEAPTAVVRLFRDSAAAGLPVTVDGCPPGVTARVGAWKPAGARRQASELTLTLTAVAAPARYTAHLTIHTGRTDVPLLLHYAGAPAVTCDPVAVLVRGRGAKARLTGKGVEFIGVTAAAGKAHATTRPLGPDVSELGVETVMSNAAPDGDYDTVTVRYTVDAGHRKEEIAIPIRIIPD